MHTKTNGSNPLTGSNADPTVQDPAQQHIGACTERRYIAQTKGSSMHEPEADDTDQRLIAQQEDTRHRSESNCTAGRPTAQTGRASRRPEEHPADGRASRRRKAYGAWRGKKQGHDKSKDMTKARTGKKDSTL